MSRSKEKTELRRTYRALRQGLSQKQQARNAANLQRNLLRTCLLLRYQRFAVYLPADGEIDTKPVQLKLREFSKQTALPCLRPSFSSAVRSSFSSTFRSSLHKRKKLQMHFAPYAKSTRLLRGPYNLLEPQTDKTPPRMQLDVILMPLVAFDHAGTRLGMGGGFYDRYAHHSSHSHLLRIGLAHSIQETSTPLPRDQWDSPLDGVITERGIVAFNRRAHTLLFNSQSDELSGAHTYGS